MPAIPSELFVKLGFSVWEDPPESIEQIIAASKKLAEPMMSYGLVSLGTDACINLH